MDILKKRLAILYFSWSFFIFIKNIIFFTVIGKSFLDILQQDGVWSLIVIGSLHLIAFFISGKNGVYLQIFILIITAILLLYWSVFDQYWLLVVLGLLHNTYSFGMWEKNRILKISMTTGFCAIIVGMAILFHLINNTIQLQITIMTYINHGFFWILNFSNIIINLVWNFQQKNKHNSINIELQNELIDYKNLSIEMGKVIIDYKNLVNQIKPLIRMEN